MIDPRYRAQVDLLLRILPHVAEEEVFALKGGTAINLFIRDMPRLSVDIDLTYLPLDDRKTGLENIAAGLRRIKERLGKAAPEVNTQILEQTDGTEAKLLCSSSRPSVAEVAAAFFQPVAPQHAAGFLRDRGGIMNAFATPDFPALMHEPARVHARRLKENAPLFIIAGRLGIALGQQHFGNIGGEIGTGHIKPCFCDDCIISMKA